MKLLGSPALSLKQSASGLNRKATIAWIDAKRLCAERAARLPVERILVFGLLVNDLDLLVEYLPGEPIKWKEGRLQNHSIEDEAATKRI
jgi:hypothetical protein